MPTTLKRLEKFALQPPTILLPNKGVDLQKWAVVACDQYTSEEEYWQRVSEYVGSAPSTLKMIYPEVYLEETNPQERITKINEVMNQYVDEGLFDSYERSFFLVHRTDEGEKSGRWGLLAALDLEQYDWFSGSSALIRASEETILDRIPPRKAIRKDAPLELPHILVLIDDPKATVIEPLSQKTDSFTHLYSTPLMEGGGRVSAWQINDEGEFALIADHLQALLDSQGLDDPFLFAMGDGNHSLATAKSCWLDIKKDLTEEEQAIHPARWALVEIQNIYDPGIIFEPIHRLLFGVEYRSFLDLLAQSCESYETREIATLNELDEFLQRQDGVQRFGYKDKERFLLFTLTNPITSLTAGTIQKVIDQLLEKQLARVDYTHGEEVTLRLGSLETNAAIILPDFPKSAFFKAVLEDGSLPRKTFSMGHAHQKRFYLEGRKIIV